MYRVFVTSKTAARHLLICPPLPDACDYGIGDMLITRQTITTMRVSWAKRPVLRLVHFCVDSTGMPG